MGSEKYLLITICVLVIIALTGMFILPVQNTPTNTTGTNNSGSDYNTSSVKMSAFFSEDEFKSYLKKSINLLYSPYSTINYYPINYYPGPVLGAGPRKEIAPLEEIPERYSTTNVQVPGIDEPDIVKTDGSYLYLSSQYSYYSYPTKIIKIFPPRDLSFVSNISDSGYLLLVPDKEILIVLRSTEILGYDVSNRNDPKELWKIKLNGSYIDARMYGDYVYLIVRKSVNVPRPCPIILSEGGSNPIVIKCTEIYHPNVVIPVEATYHILKINPENGKIVNHSSFVGSSKTTVYMSKNNIYIANYYPESYYKIMTITLKEAVKSKILPDYILEEINKIESYDLVDQAKLIQLMYVLGNYINSLSEDEQLKLQTEIENLTEKIQEKYKREFEKTIITKINVDTLKIENTGTVPGRLLNQFSMDEYNDYLRVATTVGGLSWSSEGAENDLYILDKNMEIIGSVKGFGLDERIYSVRFVKDKAYIVTFRQTDPFFVMDLSNPNDPKIVGKLKIPGYSSYLHPINEKLVLGIGKDGSKVKISLFDVSDPSNPEELDKYILSEYWSDILNTHHAFLLDTKHRIFFVPASKIGYVFSYENSRLSLKKAVNVTDVKRALYVDDYLYIVGARLIVLNENTWERINELELYKPVRRLY